MEARLVAGWVRWDESHGQREGGSGLAGAQFETTAIGGGVIVFFLVVTAGGGAIALVED